MAICIFCLKEKPPSREHFIPAALGGHIVLTDCVCEDDNNAFSGKFERKLFEELAPIRLLLQIPDRDNDIPSSEVTIRVGKKEYKGQLKDGKVVLNPIVEKVRQPDGSIELTGKYLTDAIKENWAKLVASGKWQALDAPVDEGGKEGEVHLGGELEVCSALEGLRNAAKIAFLGLVRYIGPKPVLRQEFNAIRDFIVSGQPHGVVHLFVLEQFLNFVGQGPHQHSVILAARNNENRIDAIVRIFGGMCYFVNLSSNYGGPDFYNTFVYDPARGEENGVLQTKFDAEFLQIGDVLHNRETVWDDRVLWGQRFVRYLEDAFQHAAMRR